MARIRALSLTDRRNPFHPLDEKARTFARDKYFNIEYVAWLAKFNHADATRALVREAVMSASSDVRTRAAAALAERPQTLVEFAERARWQPV